MFCNILFAIYVLQCILIQLEKSPPDYGGTNLCKALQVPEVGVTQHILKKTEPAKNIEQTYIVKSWPFHCLDYQHTPPNTNVTEVVNCSTTVYGGLDRNPERLAYIFDFDVVCQRDEVTVYVALSDGSVRIITFNWLNIIPSPTEM